MPAPTKKVTAAVQKRRSKHAEFLALAGYTIRYYARPELGDELLDLAEKIRSGELEFTPIPDDEL